MKKLFRIHTSIDASMVARFAAFLDTCDPEKDIAILHFNCKGGDILCVQQMIYFLSQKKIITVGIAFGEVYSAALLLYVACCYRVAYKNATFLVHNAYTNSAHVPEEIVRKKEKESFDFIASRIIANRKTIYRLARKKTYFTKGRAKNMGIITHFEFKKISLGLKKV